jgi:hypothetical protein
VNDPGHGASSKEIVHEIGVGVGGGSGKCTAWWRHVAGELFGTGIISGFCPIICAGGFVCFMIWYSSAKTDDTIRVFTDLAVDSLKAVERANTRGSAEATKGSDTYQNVKSTEGY